MQKERRHARINKMSSQASKKVSIIIAVTVIAILFWLSLVPWLKEGARFQHVGVWLPPFLALSLLIGTISLGIVLLEKKRLWLLMTMLSGLPIFILFGLHYIYLVFLGLLLISVLAAGQMIKRELKERYKVDIGVLSRTGVHYIVLPFLIGISFIYYFTPQLQSRVNDGLFPQSFQRTIASGVQQFIDASGEIPAGIDTKGASVQAVGVMFGRINTALKPYQPYLPPLLAFGLFIILWGVGFLFRWLGTLFARLLFYILKKTGFVKITEVEVKAERIEM